MLELSSCRKCVQTMVGKAVRYWGFDPQSRLPNTIKRETFDFILRELGLNHSFFPLNFTEKSSLLGVPDKIPSANLPRI